MVTYLLIAIGVWVLAIAAWWVSTKYLRSADNKQLQGRLTETRADAAAKKAKKKGTLSLLQAEDSKTGRIVLQLMERYKLVEGMEKMLEQAGLKWRPARLAHSCLGMFLLGFTVAWQLVPGNSTLLNSAAGLAMGFLPIWHVKRLRDKRLHKFEELFPDALEFVSRSMRAGHGFSSSLEMIHREFAEPLGSEFKRAFEEHNLGLPLDSALLKLGTRIPSLDLQFFISAVVLQKRTGGNLSEILDKLAYVIRERFKLRGKIRAISAHGKMTGTALSMIPVGVALMMFWVNPEYVKFFFDDETGQYMAGAAIGMQMLGYGIIRKIVQIEV